MNEWSCTCTPPVSFHVEGRDNFIIAFGVIEKETWLSKPIENSVLITDPKKQESFLCLRHLLPDLSRRC